MNTATFDTHTAVNALTRAGVATEQAEAISDTGRVAVSEGVATKTDIADIIGRSFSRLTVKILKIVALSFAMVLFSLSVFAEMTFLPCHEVTPQSYDEYKPVYENDPGNVRKIYNMSVKAICLGKMDEGMTLLERSSDGGHVEGSFYMGVYYETDKTFDINRNVTKDPENFNASLFYYERAVAQIEANPNYPEDTYSNVPYLEEHNQTSVQAFTMVPTMYFEGYSNAIKDMLNNRVVYTDTLEALEKMKQSSEQCLARPSLSVWKEKQEHAYQVMQVRCKAMRDFSIQVYPLEQKRIGIAEACVGSLEDCSEHNTVVYNEIAPLATKMIERYDSISL